MRILGAAVVSLAALFAIGAVLAPEQLKFASIAPERSHWGIALTNIAKLVDRYTQGSVEIHGYHGGVQGDERTVLRKLRLGQLQGAVLVGQGVSDLSAETLCFHIPFLFKDLEEARAVFEKQRPTLEAQCREKGFEVLGWPELGFSEMYSRDEIRTLDDFRQSKPWLIDDDPLSKAFFEELGTQPVATSAENVLTALQSGLLKTVFTPPAGLITLQWHSRIRYRIAESISFAFGVVVVDKKRFDALGAKEQTAVRKVFEAVIKKLDEETHEKNAEAASVMAKHGIETIKFDDAFKAEIEKASDEVAKRLSSKVFSAEVMRKVRDDLEAYRRSKS